MQPRLFLYSQNDIKISRTAKPPPRLRGDGEESTTSYTLAEAHSNSLTDICNLPKKEIIPESITSCSKINEENFIDSGLQRDCIPCVGNVAKNLANVSVFSSPDSIILTTIPKDFLSHEKFILKPVTIHVKRKPRNFTSKKKEPKFVPYEPYKGCVNPILKSIQTKGKIKETIATVSQPKLSIVEGALDKLQSNKKKVDQVPGMIADFEKEIKAWEFKNNKLSEANETLRAQLDHSKQEISNLNQHLSVQSQVNNELKKLLVASIGEDVESKVHSLTEDKARMATMIRKYSEKVDKDFEEKERISIQCDVWRSKFLASSLLLDELAQWKGILFQKLEEAKEALRLLLEERDVLHPYLLNTYKMIYQVQEAFDPLHAESTGVGILDSCDAVSLSATSSSLAENIRNRLLGTLGRSLGFSDIRLPDETRTPGEKIALQLLDECLELCTKKMSLTLNPERSPICQRFHPNARFEHLTMNCCGHCNGEIKVV